MSLGRKMTPSEIEAMTARRVELGAVGQNAVECQCGRVWHFPNGPIRNSTFSVQSCDWCNAPGYSEPFRLVFPGDED